MLINYQHLTGRRTLTSLQQWTGTTPFYMLLKVHLVMILGKWPNWRTIIFYVFISILYMFRAIPVLIIRWINCINTTSALCHSVSVTVSCAGRIVCLKCDGTRVETRFRLSPKWTSPFKSTGASVQSTAGSRGVRVLATHFIRQFFPSLPLPCVTVCHQVSNALYLHTKRSPTQSDIYQTLYIDSPDDEHGVARNM